MAVRSVAGSADISILKVERGEFKITVRGTSPLICNRMSEKAKRELLMPRGRKTAADKAQSLKHDPFEEFRASPYTLPAGAPTLIAVTAETFKAAMGTAALDLPGAHKAQIGRLVFVQGSMVPIYGEPQLVMSVVRSADINHTPDIRTRVIIPEWCADLRITYAMPQLRESAVANLLAAAGITAGVGDWRPQKGKGAYGQFELVNKDDAAAAQLRKLWGREGQMRAMKSPQKFDLETEELLAWFVAEAPKRGFKVESEAAG